MNFFSKRESEKERKENEKRSRWFCVKHRGWEKKLKSTHIFSINSFWAWVNKVAMNGVAPYTDKLQIDFHSFIIELLINSMHIKIGSWIIEGAWKIHMDSASPASGSSQLIPFCNYSQLCRRIIKMKIDEISSDANNFKKFLINQRKSKWAEHGIYRERAKEWRPDVIERKQQRWTY